MQPDSRDPQPVSQTPSASPAVWLAVALVLTFAAGVLPSSGIMVWTWQNVFGGEATLSLNLFAYLSLLAMGVLLAGSSLRQSGLIIGDIRNNWLRVLIVCGIPLLLVAFDDSETPFSDESYTMWLISPVAQDLIFIGFLYGQLERVFPGMVHRRVPLSRSLVLTSFFFAIFHLPNLAAGIDPSFMAFQLAYTGIGLLIVGLSRQWTGSILYVTLTHTIVNFLPWAMAN